MIISIDGNIGAGKSDLLAHLATVFQNRGDIEFFPEPTQEWHELFLAYMKNMKKYALPFTLEVIRQFGRVKHSTKRHQIVERHPHTTTHVFNTILKNDNILGPADLNIIEEYASVFGWTPDVIIYLDVDDATCIERVESRGRQGEDEITYEYLRAVSFQHDKLYKNILPHVKVYRTTQSVTETKAQFHARIATLVTSLTS